MAKRAREDHIRPHKQQHKPCALGCGVGILCVSIEADGVVPADEDEDGHECVPGELDEDVGEHEDGPGVGLCGSFAGFVERALGDEVGEHLWD